MEFINVLLEEYNLTIDDMKEVWGTPQLQTCDDYHSLDEYKDLSYHSISHLFSSILLDTDLFYTEDIIGLAVDGAPDIVMDPNLHKKILFRMCFEKRRSRDFSSLFPWLTLDICKKEI